MRSQGGFECRNSGTTAVTLCVTRDIFIVSNVGDSRCIIYRQGSPMTSSGVSRSVSNPYNMQNQSDWQAECLSRDHKPNNQGENERIISMNGRVDYYKDMDGKKVGPARVYAKDEDGPGLAMSRSLGDTVAEKLGVISTPDVRAVKR
jgi:integrin-linked kinase-associated serine/threonine phosphatase 2C